MFNKSEPSKEESRYLFNLTRYYKIWFSTNSEIFLGPENELRFIHMRRKNPDAILHLVYSSRCLSSNAIADLERFCNIHQIFAVDFESFRQKMIHPQDIALYELAREEISRSLNKTGGNMAAASDCARLLIPIIEQCGIYSDFDVSTNLSTLSPMVSLRGPLLKMGNYSVNFNNTITLDPNCDFLAFAVANEISFELAPDTIIAIRNLQERIIANYNMPLTLDTLFLFYSVTELQKSLLYKSSAIIFEGFIKSSSSTPSIFDFRSFLWSQEELDAKVKHFLTLLSVTSISGPAIYPLLYKNYFPKDVNRIPAAIPRDSRWLPFLKIYERCMVSYYDGIYDLVHSKNNMLEAKNSQSRVSDQSWIPCGMTAKLERETKMHNCASAIQGFWHHRLFWKNNFVHEAMCVRLKKICKEEQILKPALEKNYLLALKKAALTFNLPVVELLLFFKTQRGLSFEINTASSNGKTVLDWAMTNKPKKSSDELAQAKITELLKAAGALNQVDSASAFHCV